MAKRLLPALRKFIQVLVDRPITPGVHDEEDIRCLRFNSGVMQSSMRISAPFALDLSYTQTMMGFLLFNAEPRHILIIGLGGGSLSKYCYRQFPQTRVTTVEINPGVIALRDEFLIPADDERFQIVEADASEYMARNGVQADVILLDGYDAQGLPNSLISEAFYVNCQQALTDDGVLAANLWGGEPNRALYISRLISIFDGRVWWSKPLDSRNLIAFAVKNQHFYPHWARLTAIAQSLKTRYQLDLAHVIDHMHKRLDPDG